MLLKLFKQLSPNLELCYYVSQTSKKFSDLDKHILYYLLHYPSKNSVFPKNNNKNCFEIGPKLLWNSSWSSNVQTILGYCNINSISRIEMSFRYSEPKSFDKLTSEHYKNPLTSFTSHHNINNISTPISNIEDANKKYGFGWDSEDLTYYSSRMQML